MPYGRESQGCGNPPIERGALVRFAAEQAQVRDLVPAVFIRQIDVESGFNPNAVSPAGAIGIAQIVPRFHPGVDPCDPWASLRYAAGLDRAHLDEFGGYRLALAAYNAGAGAVRHFGGVPPYEETWRYLTLILGEGWPEPGASAGPPVPTNWVTWRQGSDMTLAALGLAALGAAGWLWLKE